ncbi:2-keto-4-pentenoate hydratase [Staphylococcus auricularis]|mgnify:FL=1|uniref:2-keto-4-pentenoate hydratase n=1 Tax=Staphylococcus auricularis TaxID=29379 RepID=UPI0012470DC0|nr:2-keto-4-pentenoate hydratase [Staphylococcus auricularis]
MAKANEEIATILHEAYQTLEPTHFISESYDLTEEEAYATQALLIDKIKQAQQTDVAGYKVSMTSAATQSIANTNEPAYGTILKNVVYHTGATIELSKCFSPLIEPELMFILSDRLSQDPSVEEIVNKVHVAPGIEVPDARYIDWFPNFTLSDLIADNTATGLIVVGEDVDPLSYEAFADIQMELTHQQAHKGSGEGSEVLGNPINAIKWLARKLATQGQSLQRGQIISSGTFMSPIPAALGTYKAQFSHVGEVNVTFV